jgi:uncharacterized protein YbaP (TraB family)
VRWLCLVVALAACQSKPAPSAGSADPWSGAGAAAAPDDPDAPPSFAELHKRADELCPRVTAPYFYRVAKAGATSYLLGTRHVSVSLAKFPPAVHDRIADAKIVVFEIPPGDRPKTKHERLHLHAVLGDKLWTRYGELVGHRNAESVEHSRPAMAILRAAMLYEDIGATLEHDVQAVAESSQIPMRGLESAEFQDGLIERLLDVRMLSAAIEYTKDRQEMADESAKSVRDYCAGIDKEVGMSAKDRAHMHDAGYTDAELDAIDNEMVYARNAKWIPDLEQLFDTGGAFVAVGAAHLRGPRGVVELLRAKGYTITRE